MLVLQATSIHEFAHAGVSGFDYGFPFGQIRGGDGAHPPCGLIDYSALSDPVWDWEYYAYFDLLNLTHPPVFLVAYY